MIIIIVGLILHLISIFLCRFIFIKLDKRGEILNELGFFIFIPIVNITMCVVLGLGALLVEIVVRVWSHIPNSMAMCVDRFSKWFWMKD